MPRAIECRLDGEKISVVKALQLRDIAKKGKLTPPKFQCIVCGKPVRPHRKGEKLAAHFEHHKRTKDCSLSVASDGR